MKPTRTRPLIDRRSHRPPADLLDNAGKLWLGTSRIIDRPARRKANRRSWARFKAEARREYVALCRLEKALDEVTA